MNLRMFQSRLRRTGSQLSLADDAGKTTGRTSQESRRCRQGDGSFTIAQHKPDHQSAQTALADADARMRRMERKIDGWEDGRGARKKARATLSALHKERDELAEWYGGLKHSSTDAWDEVKGGFVKSYETLKESFAKAAKEY
jgi:hypothetical protein